MTKKLKVNSVTSLMDKALEDIPSILSDILHFSFEEYGDLMEEKVVSFFEEYTLTEEELEYVLVYYYWWIILCSKIAPNRQTIYQMYLKRRKKKFKNKRILYRLLQEWQYATPGFYYLENVHAKYVWSLTDMFLGKTRFTSVSEINYFEPNHGDLMTGILLPLGNHYYMTLFDLFAVPYKLSPSLAKQIIQYTCNLEDGLASPQAQLSANYPEMFKMCLKKVLDNDVALIKK
ncbi:MULTISPECIES: hypothetical protein [Bacillaceae]|uniref:Uncharacterized protein n=1 Tax=Sutcliffiella horikoshii TaxID=79883 RepID=A0A5D4T076_9BACI|nr:MULTISPECIES: hypothetical protein [Bacillaceae]TYS67998.1 hypothetical protein FZC75_18555 [Sutcliffiella horikoshii]